MKNIIKKWLGINSIENRVNGIETSIYDKGEAQMEMNGVNLESTIYYKI